MRVVEVGRARRIQPTTSSAIERGRIPPLNMPGGKQGSRAQGVNGFVFAADLAPSAAGDGSPPLPLALKGVIPYAAGQSGQTSRGITDHKEEWRVPEAIGAHRHLVPVRHSFFGSSALIVPWVGAQLELGSIVRRTTWIVMPRYPVSLQSATEDVQCTGPREAALWLLGMLEATQHMLRRGAVHRDVKADNAFLAADGRVVLGDFGCGRMLYHGGRAAQLMEQFRRR